ncbi:MAG TPA: radical SAM protein, partial [Aquificae bacterium]|nr:radical SAM protein [Aquificota bacterium]
MKVLILDGYVDEPTCLGVPPYVSTYVRYVAGSLVDAGIKPDDIDYITIDKLRENLNLKNYKGDNYFKDFLSALKESYIKDYDLIVVISGLTVPGRYLGFTPISYSELLALSKLKGPIKILGGPIRFGFAFKGGNLASDISELEYEFISLGDIEKDIQIALNYIKQKDVYKILKNYRTPDEIDKWAFLGSFILKKHPLYPLLICEIETYRGCERKFHCSFCTEKLYGFPQHRSLDGILKELKSLKEVGISHIRFGRQPNILGYLALEEKDGFRKPNVKALLRLFREASLLNFDTIHIDNVNPGTIYHFPKESKEALSIIAKYDTPGDVAAFGIESADERVVLENNLKVYPDQALKAIEIVNEVGAFKLEKFGEYKLLPGLNFLVGLKGETRKTFKKNIKFLEEILKRDLLIRRVNIRQVMIFPGTVLYEEEISPKTKYQKEFKHFKY